MKTRYARIKNTIVLRGARFPAGTIIKVWEAGKVTSIQPLHLPTREHGVLWYAFPKIHWKHVVPLDEIECALIDFGLL